MTLGFHTDFVPAVIAGTKPHTIRLRERWRVGMSIQFYQHARQKTMAKFRPDAVALVVQEISIRVPRKGAQPVIIVDKRTLTPLECQELSRRDGFEDFKELLDWFAAHGGLPFNGQLIGWTSLRY